MLSHECAPYNVLVNSLNTGVLWTEQWDTRATKLAQSRSITHAEARQVIEQGAAGRVPMGRMGDPDEFARLALFLCSEAGSYITGTAINVDGGMSSAL